jgi:hypothetical protein
MSIRNGDKARFGRLRKQRNLLRKHIRDARDAMENKAARTAIPASEYDGTPAVSLKPIG